MTQPLPLDFRPVLTPPRIVAFDLALAATGLAWTHDHTGPALGLRTAAPRTGGQERVWDINVEVAAACRIQPDLAVIEGYSYGSYRGGPGNGPGLDTLCKLAELRGVVTQWLWHQTIPVAVVAPQTRAKYATGDGRASKAQVLRAARLTYGPLLIDGPASIGDHNQADARVLLAMACDHLGVPLVEVPDTHRRALSSVEWPAVAEIPCRAARQDTAARRGYGAMPP